MQFDTQDRVLVETQGRSVEDGYTWLVRLKKQLLSEKSGDTDKPAITDKPMLNVDNKPDSEVAKNDLSNKVTETEPKPAESPVKLSIRRTPKTKTDAQKLQDAVRMMKSARFSDAELALENLLGGSKDQQARLHLIALFQQQNNLDRRIELIVEGVQLYPGNKQFAKLEAGQLFKQKSYTELIRKFAHYQNDLSLLNLLAASYQHTEQHDLAIATYQKALSMDAQQPRLWISMAISQQHRKQHAQALQSYRMALRSGLANETLKSFVEQRIQRLSN